MDYRLDPPARNRRCVCGHAWDDHKEQLTDEEEFLYLDIHHSCTVTDCGCNNFEALTKAKARERWEA